MPMDIYERVNQDQIARSSQISAEPTPVRGFPAARPDLPRDKNGVAYEPCPGCEPKEPGPGTFGDADMRLASNRAFEERRMREDKEIAEENYRRQRFSGTMGGAVEARHGFAIAIESMKYGKAVTRAGWNGRGMWIAIHKEPRIGYGDYIFIRTANGTSIPWVASQTDLLANDWIVL